MKTSVSITKRTKALAAGLALFVALVVAVVGLFASPQSVSRTAAVVLQASPQTAAKPDTTNAARVDLRKVEPKTPVAAQIAVAPKLADAPKPEAKKGRVIGAGEASYYGPGFAGRPTANGERFDPSAMTAAHRSLPFGAKVRVTNVDNGRSVVVRVNDRGPYAKGRLIDVSQGAAKKLGMMASGTAQVRLEVIA